MIIYKYCPFQRKTEQTHAKEPDVGVQNVKGRTGPHKDQSLVF